MALAGQAAMVAQFAGVDAYGLIKMIADAAQTVRRNRATCLQLARRARMIGDLMHQLHAAHLMQQPETRNPMEQLEETLRRALSLVRSCQRRGYLYRCLMGARHADELREVQGEITFYLQLFPLLSYVDTTLTWVRLLNKPAPAPQPTSCKEAQAQAPVVRPYFVPDEWCLLVIHSGSTPWHCIYYAWFTSFSSCNNSFWQNLFWHLSAGVKIVMRLTDYFFSDHFIGRISNYLASTMFLTTAS
ncbi:cell number regulator 13-like [Hordeum vulgare subsp. vulgare]|uniref:MCAfunc domain-containing protein n=1 Tax=Hordeum vulgare subsp. vulgare TaxID=112509 RepID=A0A8I6Y7P0_HORVV|nr:cell number regulator 13-like [Hordeum vulgare subsp. vulgare]